MLRDKAFNLYPEYMLCLQEEPFGMRKYVFEAKVRERDMSDVFYSTMYVGYEGNPSSTCQDDARVALARLCMDLPELEAFPFLYLPTTPYINRGTYHDNFNQ